MKKISRGFLFSLRSNLVGLFHDVHHLYKDFGVLLHKVNDLTPLLCGGFQLFLLLIGGSPRPGAVSVVYLLDYLEGLIYIYELLIP